MLKQASVDQLRQQTLPREHSWIVIAMRHYPRGVKKEWSNEFRHILAPSEDLLREWKTFEKEFGHEHAFVASNYEERFELSPTALYLLKKYSEQSHDKDIYLVCQCDLGERCHREMLLLIAQKKYGALIDPVFHTYPQLEKRIPLLNDTIKLG